MHTNLRKSRELRMEAFDSLEELKSKNVSRKEIIDEIHAEYGISKGTIYSWYSGSNLPCGRKGEIIYCKELFYVIGALFGDGCIYRWKPTNNYVILVGDLKFTTKYAKMVTKCTGIKTRAYIDRSKNIWFVKSNNYELFSLFKKVKGDLNYLKQLLNQINKSSALFFLEGFFDAEGCVKVITGKERKTPKICLDLTNINFELLEITRSLFMQYLRIEAKYSSQKSHTGKDGYWRQAVFHLRIYKKDFIRRFFENINTTKLKENKIPYLEKWLNNGL
ncbi:MAG: LAGLIDADG family homing endonuclease [Nanoarchaeota archaeon]